MQDSCTCIIPWFLDPVVMVRMHPGPTAPDIVWVGWGLRSLGQQHSLQVSGVILLKVGELSMHHCALEVSPTQRAWPPLSIQQATWPFEWLVL